jgi:hypothetical protein
VFVSPIPNYVEAGSRLVVVEIYDSTPAGPGYLTLMGESIRQLDGSPIPPDWVEKYNVRWKIPIHIEPKRRNTNQLRFVNDPIISIVESPNQPIYNTTINEFIETNYNLKLTNSQDGLVSKGYYVDLDIPISGSSVDDLFYFTSPKVGGLFTGSIIRQEKRIVEDNAGLPVDVNFVFPTASTVLSQPLGRVFNNKIGFISGSIVFSDGSRIVDLSGVISGSFREDISFFTFTSGASTYFSRSIVEYTSSVSFQYPTYSQSIKPLVSGSTLFFRMTNLDTHTGEITRIKVSSKPHLHDISGFETLYEYIPEESDILVESSSFIGSPNADIVFEIGSFVTSSHLESYWFGSYLSSSGVFDSEYYNTGSAPHINMITSSFVSGEVTRGVGGLLDGVYLYDTSSLYTASAMVLGTRKPYLFSENTAYSFRYNASYLRKTTFPNSDSWPTEYQYDIPRGHVRVYLTSPTSSLSQTHKDSSAVPIINDPLGFLIDEIIIDSDDKSNMYDKEAFFFVPRTGLANLRIVVFDGYWEFSDIHIHPVRELGFSDDEVLFTVNNTSLKECTHIFKTEFFDINNNSINLRPISDPLEIVGPISTISQFNPTVFTVTTFAISDGVITDYALSGSTTEDSAMVLVNGVEQKPTEHFSISGATLTFVASPPSGSEIMVRSLSIS